MRVLLGNVDPKAYPKTRDPDYEGMVDPDRDAEGGNDPGVTAINFPDGVGIAEAFQTITMKGGVWHHQAFGAPEWVWSDNAALAEMLADHWSWEDVLDDNGDVIDRRQVDPPAIGIPGDVEDRYHTPAGAPGADEVDDDHATDWRKVRDAKAANVRKARRPKATGSTTLMTLTLVSWLLLVFAATRLALRTNAGIDHQSRVTFDTASNGTGSYAPATYIALTENNTAPASGDTALTGEITGEGLARAQATYAHTNGTNTTTLTKTFTKTSGADRTIAKAGLFNASSAGTMPYSTLVSPVAAMTINDSVAVTWTFTF